MQIGHQTGKIRLASPIAAHVYNVSFDIVATSAAYPALSGRVRVTVVVVGLSGKKSLFVVAVSDDGQELMKTVGTLTLAQNLAMLS